MLFDNTDNEEGAITESLVNTQLEEAVERATHEEACILQNLQDEVTEEFIRKLDQVLLMSK